MANPVISISGGPSKFDLMTALFADDRKHQHTVWFTVDASAEAVNIPEPVFDGRIEAMVIGCRRANRNGDSWEIEGSYFEKNHRSRRFKALYVTTHRHGVFEIIEPVPSA
ncbi:MAG: hypothetical protein PHI73_05100 [Patescibacteria group bacterium]|nr:hypothetical protein [Patescibacteria group bacterium]